MKVKQHNKLTFLKQIFLIIYLILLNQHLAFAAFNESEFELVYSPAPYFPVEARAKNIKGFIEVEINFNQEGQVIDIDVLAAKNRTTFIKSVLYSVATWKIKPSDLSSRVIQKRFDFNLVYHTLEFQRLNNQYPVSGQKKANNLPWDYQSYKEMLVTLKNSYKEYVVRKHALNFQRK
ncbi:MAG: TonB family protein [Alteromonadaceae bacterium]|jgi:TonB family protein